MSTDPYSIPVPGEEAPKSFLGRWLIQPPGAEGHEKAHPQWPWYQVLWLTGVDYFSTLGYQPGLALLAAGMLAPLATGVLVLVTLFGALPIYREVAKRSFQGNGSISMLEQLLPGWKGKLFVLGLIGFATTDFIITMTLSAADAAEHAVGNHYLEHYLEGYQLELTLGLLALLAIVFLKGFREAIGVAVAIAVPYLLLNLVVVVAGFLELSRRPELLTNWTLELQHHGGVGPLVVASVLIFPKLALGLSGFETGVTVMPLIKGHPADTTTPLPHGRIGSTQKLLAAAAVIMSFFLISTSLITSTLIPEEAWKEGGEASGKALAWLAESLLGPNFATLYDLFSILILWFAGASAMAAMLNLIPRYLPRFGMAPHWVSHPRPLILVLFGIDMLVTLAFDADVEKQGGAYATGVLALICSAAVAVTLANWREAQEEKERPTKAILFGVITLVFTYTFVDNIVERPDGIIISSIFIISIVVSGAVSRYFRATEFRIEKMNFETPGDQKLFDQLRTQKLNLVAVKNTDTTYWSHKKHIEQHYKVDGPIVFLHIELDPDRSRFDSSITVKTGRVGEEDYRITVYRAVAVANTIAYLSELLTPASIFLGLTQRNPVSQAIRYLLWGEGETGILVYQILLRYWDWTPEEDARPKIFLMSD
jgi:hypothetical protein